MNSTLNSQVAVEPGSWNAWLVALRPKTLWIAVVPVFVGTSLAVAETGQVNPLIAFLALVASILLQILTNLQNDVGYTKRGAESPAGANFLSLVFFQSISFIPERSPAHL